MKILEEIGLTKRESQTYTLLLSLGESRFSTIQKELKLHPQIVYRCMESLKRKGLVSVYKRKGRFHAIAESPKELVRIEKDRLAEVQAILPDLIALQQKPTTPLLHTAKGSTALADFRERAYQRMKKGDTLFIIGGSGDRFYTALGDSYASVERQRIRKKITKKLISVQSEREKFLENDTQREYSDFKFLPDSFPIVSSTNIYLDTVAIIIWAEEPVLMTIQNKDVADSYKNYFKQLWKLAEY